MEFAVKSLGFTLQGFEFWVQGLGFRVNGDPMVKVLCAQRTAFFGKASIIWV
jgi:hypothetical protein